MVHVPRTILRIWLLVGLPKVYRIFEINQDLKAVPTVMSSFDSCRSTIDRERKRTSPISYRGQIPHSIGHIHTLERVVSTWDYGRELRDAGGEFRLKFCHDSLSIGKQKQLP